MISVVVFFVVIIGICAWDMTTWHGQEYDGDQD
jgi:hypothetical protein